MPAATPANQSDHEEPEEKKSLKSSTDSQVRLMQMIVPPKDTKRVKPVPQVKLSPISNIIAHASGIYEKPSTESFYAEIEIERRRSLESHASDNMEWNLEKKKIIPSAQKHKKT